jgi:hypothetical protein
MVKWYKGLILIARGDNSGLNGNTDRGSGRGLLVVPVPGLP